MESINVKNELNKLDSDHDYGGWVWLSEMAHIFPSFPIVESFGIVGNACSILQESHHFTPKEDLVVCTTMHMVTLSHLLIQPLKHVSNRSFCR